MNWAVPFGIAFTLCIGWLAATLLMFPLRDKPHPQAETSPARRRGAEVTADES